MTMASDNSKLSPCCRSYGEAEWIDSLLNRVDPRQIAVMAAHARTCPSCREMVAFWEPILADGGANGQSGAQPPDMPDSSIAVKLRRTVASIGRRRLIARRWKRLAPRIAALAFVAVMTWALTSLGGHEGNSYFHERDEYVAHYEPGAVDLVNDPQTASYRIASDYGDSGQSYVWYNVRSGEMLVLVDGLLPSNGYAIQAWAIRDKDHVNLGMLRQQELRRAHLYVKHSELSDYRNVALTIEPDGGSLAPTTPDILWIPIRE